MPFSELLRYVACADVGAIFHDWKRSSGYWMASPDRLAGYVACGVPVLCSNVPNLEAIVYRYGLGLCCNPYDPVEIAQAIRKLVEEPPGLEERRRHVRAMFEQHLNFEAHGHKLVAALHELLKAPHAGGVGQGR
jgi:glycosyltransferase involved in cell wall biosynthesis